MKKIKLTLITSLLLCSIAYSQLASANISIPVAQAKNISTLSEDTDSESTNKPLFPFFENTI